MNPSIKRTQDNSKGHITQEVSTQSPHNFREKIRSLHISINTATMTDIERATVPFACNESLNGEAPTDTVSSDFFFISPKRMKCQQAGYSAPSYPMKLQDLRRQDLHNIQAETERDDFFLLSPEDLEHEDRRYHSPAISSNSSLSMDITDENIEPETPKRHHGRNNDNEAILLTPRKDHSPSSLSPPPPPAPRGAHYRRSDDTAFPVFIPLPRNREPFTLMMNGSRSNRRNVMISRAA